MSNRASNHRQRNDRESVLGIVAALIVIAAIIVFLWLKSSSPIPSTQDEQRRYFEDTHFWVSGKFLEFWNANGGLDIFGYPISAEYNEDGILVQYFQKARMEWHVSGPYANSVTLGKLGKELGFQSEGLQEPTCSTRRCLYFEETQHTVDQFFLKYFLEYGGVEFFGPPITETYVEDQKIVQYFERLKLVWDPGLMCVTTGNLGDLYVMTYRDTFAENVLTPLDAQYVGIQQPELSVLLVLNHATLRSDATQSVTVIVSKQDAESSVVPDANVTIILTTKSGQPIEAWHHSGSTNADGMLTTSIPLSSFISGDIIVVKVEASYGTQKANDEKSFVVW